MDIFLALLKGLFRDYVFVVLGFLSRSKMYIRGMILVLLQGIFILGLTKVPFGEYIFFFLGFLSKS